MTETVRLRASYFGGGPGAGGIAELEIRHRSDATEVWIGDEDLEEPFRAASLPPSRGWRNDVAGLAELDVGLPEETLPADVDVAGTEGIAAELYALAWCDGVPKRIAKAFVSCSDAQLEALRETEGTFLDPRFIERMEELFECIEDAGHDEENLGALLKALGERPISLEAFSTEVAEWRRQAEQERERRRAEEDQRLAPFADAADRLLREWVRLHPPRSNNEQIGFGMKRARLSQFLRDYVLQRGELPVGLQSIPSYSQASGSFPFEVDFDRLQQDATS